MERNLAWCGVLALLAGVATAGCQRAPEGAPVGAGASGAEWPGVAAPIAEGNQRVWSGLLPCSDCQGVDTRLVLRMQDRKRNYLVTETYIGGQAPNRFSRAGRWSESVRLVDGERQTFYTLDPGEGGEVYALQADGSLQLLDGQGRPRAQPIAYRLQRL